MPCQSGPSLENRLQDDLDKVTQLLCVLCEKYKGEMANWSPELRRWWDDHQEQDRTRIEKERMAEERARQSVHLIDGGSSVAYRLHPKCDFNKPFRVAKTQDQIKLAWKLMAQTDAEFDEELGELWIQDE